MTMFEAWAIWSGNQPDRITEGAGTRECPKPPCQDRPASALKQLNERILHDIGVSKLGFPLRHH